MRRVIIVGSLWAASCAGQIWAGADSEQSSVRDAAIEWADYYARAYDVPPVFVAAIIDVESAWQPHALSEKGAAGLMQLMPATAYQFGIRNRFRIDENIRGGVAYLAQLMRQFDRDLRLVAAAYYAGEKRIRKLGLNCADPGIYRYVMAVQRSYRTRQMVMRRNS
jgi:soluble lytic murein transglycosylase-like protein